MKIDASEFPIVRLHYNHEPAMTMQALLDEWTALLARQQPMVMLADGGLGERKADMADQRTMTLWMKAHKSALVQYVLAQVHVVNDAAEQQMAQDFVPTFLKFWGYPMQLAESAEQGLSQARALLAGSAAAGKEPQGA